MKQITKPNFSASELGFTMVELMVSLTLGLLLTAAVIQSYLSTKQTHRVTEGVSRVQENARFSLHFITKDLRNAGFSSCIGRVRNKLQGNPEDYISFGAAVSGWNYQGTESGNTSFTLSGNTLTLPASAANWTKSDGGGFSSPPPWLEGKIVAGSDILWFKNYEELDLKIDSHNDTAAEINVVGKNGIDPMTILLVGNCSEAELFQHIASSNGQQANLVAAEGQKGEPGNRPSPSNAGGGGGGAPKWSRTYGPEDTLYGFVQTVYYIGQGASGLPSLFRYRTSLSNENITAADVSSKTEELVEGVETMQILYGEDITNDGNPNSYVSANQVTNWDNVVSTRVGVMLRSPNSATDSDQAAEYSLLDSIKFNHQSTDNILRYSVNTTVKLRNRGLDKNLAYYVCNAPTTKQGEDQNDPTPECT